jgi:predicted nuclease of predicted toxin-antitoxin system
VRLLLDEMFDPEIARQLRKRGHDVGAIAELSELRSLSDREVLLWATTSDRVLVSENVQDFLPLHLEMAAASAGHAGLILTTHRKYPRTRRGIGGLVKALVALCEQPELDIADRVHWL